MDAIPESLERFRDEFRDALRRDKRRPRRISWPLRVAAVAGTAVAIVVVLLATRAATNAPTADAAVVTRIRAALVAPAGSVLHEKVISTLSDGTVLPYELWQQADAPHEYRVLKGKGEGGYTGSALETYDPNSNTITETAASTPIPVDDPAVDLRRLLDSGNARVTDSTTLNGQSVYVIAVHAAGGSYLDGTVYADRSTYRPVRVQSDLNCDPSGKCSGRETTDFLTYEFLPPSDGNQALTSLVAQHPTARIVVAATTDPTPTTTGVKPPASGDASTTAVPTDTSPAPATGPKPAPATG